MEFLLPVFLKLFPNMLPSTFQDKMKEQVPYLAIHLLAFVFLFKVLLGCVIYVVPKLLIGTYQVPLSHKKK